MMPRCQALCADEASSRTRKCSDSQSSLNIQVTKEHLMTTALTTTTSLTSNQQELVCPRPDFLKLLKSVGAKGTNSLTGELFTFQQLFTYLREYIRLQELYDPYDPSVIHCGGDPLGEVLGVGCFTLYDTFGLLRKNVETSSLSTGVLEAALPSTSHDGSQAARYDGDEPEQKRRRTRRKRRTRCDSNGTTDGKARCRRRQSSFSIVYTSEGEGGNGDEPWYLTLEVEDTAGESEVLSVQSKETVLVQSSSDDLWFLDEDEEVEHISVELSTEDISIELQTSQQHPYLEEYEVESSSGTSASRSGEDGESSKSPIEEIMLMCDDSDIVFWADSESSDAEPDSTDDEDLSDADRWLCAECSTMNSPLCRYCDRCWKIRPGWLNSDLPPSSTSALPLASTPEKTDVSPSSPSLQGAYFNRESFMNRVNEARSRASPRLRSHSSSSCASVSPLKKIGIMPVTEKVHLLLDKSAPASEVRSEVSEHCDSNTAASSYSTTAATFQVDNLVTPSSPGCSSKLASPQSRRRHRVPIMRRDDSGLGSSQLSQHFPSISSQQSSKSSQNEAIAGPSKVESPASKQTRLPHPLSVKASPCKSISSVNHLAASDMCVICFSKPKEASIVHGKTGHQVCCYKCARRLRRRGKPCPVCRRPIQAVIKNFVL